MKKYGYLRVSTQDQSHDRQIDGLSALCDELHLETASASSLKRPVYSALMKRLKPGDALIVWALDRAFRSTIDAIREAERLRSQGVSFQIVSLDVDTGTADGMLTYTMVAAISEHERRRISERTKEGLAAARKRGRFPGRPPKLSRDDLGVIARKLKEPGARICDFAKEAGMAPWSLSRALKREGLR